MATGIFGRGNREGETERGVDVTEAGKPVTEIKSNTAK